MVTKRKDPNAEPDLYYFEFHYHLWKGSIRVQQMSRAETACYLDLLIHCFERGGFKDSISDMAYICNRSRQSDMKTWWNGIKDCFYFDQETQVWRNKKMDHIKADVLERFPPKNGTMAARLGQVGDTVTASGGQPGSTAVAPSLHGQDNFNHLNNLPDRKEEIRVDHTRQEDKDHPLKDQTPLGQASLPPSQTDPIGTPSLTLIPFASEPPPSPQDKTPTTVVEAEEEDELPCLPDSEMFPAVTLACGDEFDPPNTVEQLEVTKAFQKIGGIRLAALPQSASLLQQAFFNPWADPCWLGNNQNRTISIMHRFNLLSRFPGRLEEGLGTAEMVRLMPDALEILNYIGRFELKAQIALHYNYNKPPSESFVIFLANYFNTNLASNYVEEYAYKMLKSRPWGRKEGIPVMLPVEISPDSWAIKPALVWGFGKATDIKPVYALLGANGEPIKKTPTHIHDFEWNYYDYAAVQEEFKARDKAKKRSSR